MASELHSRMTEFSKNNNCFSTQYTKNGGEYTRLPLNYQMNIKYTKWP
jgi:hypothetical protein